MPPCLLWGAMLSKCTGWTILSLACPRLPSASGQRHYPPGRELHGGLSQAPAAGCFPGPLHLHRQVYPDPPEAACGETPAGRDLRPLFPSPRLLWTPPCPAHVAHVAGALRVSVLRALTGTAGALSGRPCVHITHQETVSSQVESVGRSVRCRWLAGAWGCSACLHCPPTGLPFCA